MHMLLKSVAAFVLSVPLQAVAAAGAWSTTGPNGGYTADLLVNPLNADVLYVSTQAGVFRTSDGATSWTRAQSGIVGRIGYEAPLVMDADAPDRLWTVDTSGRLFRTVDGASNWSATGYVVPTVNTVPLSVVFADVPGAANLGQLYLVANSAFEPRPEQGIYKSTNGGASFAQLGGATIPANQPFASIAVDPSNPLLVLAGTDFYGAEGGATSVGQIFRSIDGGASWTPVLSLASTSASAVDSIAFGAGTTVYATSGDSLLQSSDDGLTWITRGAFGFANSIVRTSVAAHPTIANTVYVLGGQGLRVSTDGGATIALPIGGLAPIPSYLSTSTPAVPAQSRVRRLRFAPGFPAPGSAIWVATADAGVFRSVDGGTSWSSSGVNAGLASVNIRAIAVQRDPAGTGQGRRIFAGFGDPSGPSPAFFRGTSAAPPGAPLAWATANSGLRAAQIRSIAVDPTTSATLGTTVVYAVGRSAPNQFVRDGAANLQRIFTNSGIYKSINGGGSWTTLESGFPRSGAPPNDFTTLGTVRTIVLDPRACGSPPFPTTGAACVVGPLQRVLAVTSGANATAPDPGGGPVLRTNPFRIAQSLDAGATWTDRSGNLPPPINRLVDFDGPGPEPGQNFIVERITLVPLVFDPSNSNTLYVGTFLTQGWLSPTGDFLDPQPIPTIASGVFKSTDGGATWVQASSGLPRYSGSVNSAHDVLALAIHPTTPSILWATTATTGATTDPFQTSLYKTIDGGLNWTESRSGIPVGLDIRALLVDPTDGNVLYAAGGGSESNPGAVYKSDDGGATWRSISIGLPADSALALALDPVNRTVIHAGTNLGLWSQTQLPDADGDGAPNNTENNAPNAGDGNADGEPDAIQGDVGSSIVLDNRAADAASPQGSLGGSFTADVQTTGSCQQLNSVQGLFPAQYGPDRIPQSTRFFDYPRDMIRFEVPNCGQIVVDVTFHDLGTGGLPNFNDSQWSFRIYAPQVPGNDASLGFYDLGARAQVVGPNKWRLTIAANQFGSYRPDPNSILFVGGPAFNQDRLFGSSFEP